MEQTARSTGDWTARNNNAGIQGAMAITAERTRENWDRRIAINLTGVWVSKKYELPRMVAQGIGAIVDASSVAGLVGSRCFAPTWSCLRAQQTRHHGADAHRRAGVRSAWIRVNAVCPGVIRTPMTDRMISDAETEAQVQRVGANGADGLG